MRKHFCPTATTEEINKFQRDISLWVYQKGLPLSIFEDNSFNAIIHQIRPGIRAPTRSLISGRYLEYWNNECKSASTSYLAGPSHMITLGSDSWTDVNQCSIINFVALSHKKTILIDSLNTGDESHTAEVLFREHSKIIDQFPNNIIGCCTDNASPNKCMWTMVTNTYPDKFAYGCNCHALHLLVKDLFTLPLSYKNNPTSFPMHPYLQLIDDISEIVRMFRRGKERLRMLHLIKENKNLKQLSLFAETRWGGLYQMLHRFNLWLPTFYSLVTNSEWREKGTASTLKTKELMRNVLLSPNFEKEFKAALKITELININLLKSESDMYYISDVCADWMKLISEFNTLEISPEQIIYCREAGVQRWDFIKSPCHLIGYVLDPRYYGKRLNLRDRTQAKNSIKSYKIIPDCSEEAIRIELDSYIIAVIQNQEPISDPIAW